MATPFADERWQSRLDHGNVYCGITFATNGAIEFSDVVFGLGCANAFQLRGRYTTTATSSYHRVHAVFDQGIFQPYTDKWIVLSAPFTVLFDVEYAIGNFTVRLPYDKQARCTKRLLVTVEPGHIGTSPEVNYFGNPYIPDLRDEFVTHGPWQPKVFYASCCKPSDNVGQGGETK